MEGLKRGTVAVVPHDSRWQEEARQCMDAPSGRGEGVRAAEAGPGCKVRRGPQGIYRREAGVH